MISMIIVEDESFERKSLINCIDWELIGVEIVGEASEGETGLALVKKFKPQMVLTDINMPVMNAIEMSAQIRKINTDIKILFISSYSDFEYAKQAIELNIFAYITKPVNEGELLRTVKRAADSITEKMLEDKIYSNIKNNYKKDLVLIREALLLRILMGEQIEVKEVEKAKLNWLFYKNEEAFCIFSVVYENTEIHQLSFHVENLENICKELCNEAISVCFHRRNIIIIASIKKANLKYLVIKLEQKIEQYLNTSGFKGVRIKKEYSPDTSASIVQLYDNICQKGLLYSNQIPYQKSKKLKSKQEIVEEIEKIILSKYGEPLSTEGIAKIMHFTPNYIGMVFKNMKKESINHYLTTVRMEAAKKLLLETNLTVNEISYQCGFDNVTYFHTLFKKENEITPNEFRSAGKPQTGGLC